MLPLTSDALSLANATILRVSEAPFFAATDDDPSGMFATIACVFVYFVCVLCAFICVCPSGMLSAIVCLFLLFVFFFFLLCVFCVFLCMS